MNRVEKPNVVEILNIDYHISRLVVKALNKSELQTDAAKLLGVCSKTVAFLIKSYGIVWDQFEKIYKLSEAPINEKKRWGKSSKIKNKKRSKENYTY